MKKIIVLIGLVAFLFLTSGCDTMNTPTKRVEEFFGKYNSLDNAVISDLELATEKEQLSDDNAKLYDEVMKKQYQDMKYEIVNENINGDDAVVTTKITVYDYYKISLNADSYLTDNQEQFMNSGSYDETSFIKYKLDQMKNTKEQIEYTIEIYLNKLDDKWTIQELDDITKEKIHGLYNYEV